MTVARKAASRICLALVMLVIICSRTVNMATTAQMRRASRALDVTLFDPITLTAPAARKSTRARRTGEPGREPGARYWAASQTPAASRNNTARMLEGSRALDDAATDVEPAVRWLSFARSRLLRVISITM